jgi:hypothetical protein
LSFSLQLKRFLEEARMSLSKPIFAVLTYGIDADQRQKIHELLKTESAGWWHHFPDVWFVRGHDAKYWKSVVADIVTTKPGAAVLVMKLDNVTKEAAWSGEGKTEMYDWLKTHFRKE